MSEIFDSIVVSEEVKKEVDEQFKNMTELDKWKKVNLTETFDELADVILSFADDNGMIQGRYRRFNATKMSVLCKHFSILQPEVLTREYGIRQQAMYIYYYTAPKITISSYDDKDKDIVNKSKD
jgi:hypothetical protein